MLITTEKGSISKVSKIADIRRKSPSVRGRKIFQPISINWSYLYRGKVARTRMYKKLNTDILNAKASDAKNPDWTVTRGISHPPIKIKQIRLDINNILLYSPRKNKANAIEPYSTL